MWYAMEDTAAQWEADVFYLVSTEILFSFDSAGNELYNAALTPDEKQALNQEMDYVKRYLGDSLNFVSPYYHQFTMNAILLSEDSFRMAYDVALNDVKEAFRCYLKRNPDRPFVLAGFSQGAMLVLDLIKQMPEEAYHRCRGAYMLGYRLTEEDLANPHVVLATSATEGKVVSFNTVARLEAQWDFVSKGAAACINPLNWTTDTTTATLYYQQDTIYIRQDMASHQLLAQLPDEQRYVMPGTECWWQHGCLHHWDLLFYLKSIHQNMLLRTR